MKKYYISICTMQPNELTSRPGGGEAVQFLEQWTKGDDKWLNSELPGFVDISSYYQFYHSLEGEWRIWETASGGEAIGITYHMKAAPSNKKPWIGTIIVRPDSRNNGLGRIIIGLLGEELIACGHKALFAGVQIQKYGWIDFLSKCLFEQLKIESSQSEQYMVLVRPLS